MQCPFNSCDIYYFGDVKLVPEFADPPLTGFNNGLIIIKAVSFLG